MRGTESWALFKCKRRAFEKWLEGCAKYRNKINQKVKTEKR